MRRCIALALVSWMTVAMALAATAADSDAPAGKDNEVTQLKAEMRVMRAQMGQMQQRLDALSARVGRAAPAQAPRRRPAAVTPGSRERARLGGAARHHAGGRRAGRGNALARDHAERGRWRYRARRRDPVVMPGAMSGATAKPPGFAMSSAPQGQGVIIPSIQGVPQTFIPDIGGVGDIPFRQATCITATRVTTRPTISSPARHAAHLLLTHRPIHQRANLDRQAQRRLLQHRGSVPGLQQAAVGPQPARRPVPHRLRVNQRARHFPAPDGQSAQGSRAIIGHDGFVIPGVNLSTYVPNPWEIDLKADLNVVSRRILSPSTIATARPSTSPISVA